MKVVIDLNICQDHGQCVFAAPEVFSLDGEGHIKWVENPDESLRAKVEDAADVCPLQAITIQD